MNFGLLLPNLPHVQHSHAQDVHPDAVPALQPREALKWVAFWRRFKSLVS